MGSDYAKSFERITERVEKIRLARALVKQGHRDDALKLLRSVLAECEGGHTKDMVERLVKELEDGADRI